MVFLKGYFRGSQHFYFPLYLIAFFQQQRPGSQLSGAKNRIDLSQLDQFLSFLYSKNPFLNQKFYALLCALFKKIEYVLASNSKTGRDNSKTI
jgi:hypothetical protein